MEHAIQEIARLAGTTSRTLRHYDDIGLLEPSRIGANGYRYYDENALLRLQRILLLRELGLGLPQIATVLDASTDQSTALQAHLDFLRSEQLRLTRQIAAVQHTINAVKGQEKLMAQDMFDGFDHTVHQQEVEERWGKDAYARSDAWWRGLGSAGQQDMKIRVAELNADWIAAAADPGIAPDSPRAQELAKRHVQWLSGIPGTPENTRDYVLGLARMYVEDERFAANYGGLQGATLVRDALLVHLGSTP